MIQHTQARLDRADSYMQAAAFARGIARGFVDIGDRLTESYVPGNDPARQALATVMVELRAHRTEMLARALRLEARAEHLRAMVSEPTNA